MSDLFTSANASRPKPLAALLRPEGLEQVVGQRHLIGPGKPLTKRVAAGRIGTVVLYGPPGVGKTTIALAIGAQLGKEFHKLHPAEHKLEHIRKVADEARFKNVLVFVDEVHRYSSTIQDHLLGLTEEGVFDFVAATTENPFHSLTKALVSRSTVMRLEPISVEDMELLVERAIAHVSRDGVTVEVSDGAMGKLCSRSGGDARRLLTTFETLTLGAGRGDVVTITEPDVDEAYATAPIPYDRSGDVHYDAVSSFVKSMRASDPDATLYWLAVLIHGGEPPEYIARRILIHASEDVGLADNSALATAHAALAAVEHVGYPEARITLAHAALHVALAPKSNSAYRGIHLALEHVQRNGAIHAPGHLRDTHYKGAASLGAVGYVYPHDLPDAWAGQENVPGVPRGAFYQSDARGGATFEARANAHWDTVSGDPIPRRFP